MKKKKIEQKDMNFTEALFRFNLSDDLVKILQEMSMQDEDIQQQRMDMMVGLLDKFEQLVFEFNYREDKNRVGAMEINCGYWDSPKAKRIFHLKLQLIDYEFRDLDLDKIPLDDKNVAFWMKRDLVN